MIFTVTIIASSIGAVALAVGIARASRSSAYETETSRLLLLAGMSSVLLCAALSLLLLFACLREGVLLGHLPPGRILACLLLLSVPFRIAWNYFRIPATIVSAYEATRVSAEDVPEWLTRSFRSIRTRLPAVYVSSVARGPMVFGRSTAAAALLLPRSWLDQDYDRPPASLLHEIGHLRHSDVGFLSWGDSFVQGGLWPALVSLVVLLLGFGSGLEEWQIAASAAGVHLICYIQLFIFVTVVTRAREGLADSFARAMTPGTQVRAERTSVDMSYLLPEKGAPPRCSRTRRSGQLYRFLQDKAILSEKAWLWRPVARAFSYLYLRQPMPSFRQTSEYVNGEAAGADGRLGEGETSFWAGVSLGNFIVTLTVLGSLMVLLSRSASAPEDILVVPFQWFGALGPLVPAFLAALLSMPDSCSPRVPGWKRIGRLACRHAVAACAALASSLSLLLFAGFVADTGFLIGFSLVLALTGVTVSFVLSLVGQHVWLAVRTWTRRNTTEIAGLFGVVAPTLLTFAAILAGSISALFYGRQIGKAAFLGGIGGLGWVLFASSGTISVEDAFLELRCGPFREKLEGSSYRRRGPFLLWVYLCTPVFVGVVLTTVILYPVIDTVYPGLPPELAIVFSLPLLFIEALVAWKLGSATRYPKLVGWASVERLAGCLRFFDRDTAEHREARALVKEESQNVLHHVSRESNLSTLGTRYCIVAATDHLARDSAGAASILKWVLRCRCSEGGFGLWPGASPRISCTCFAVRILSRAGRLADLRKKDVQWLRSNQREDGLFRCRHGNRPEWEQTRFAVESLSIPGERLGASAACRCAEPMLENLREACRRDDAPKVAACLWTLDRLGFCGAEATRQGQRWIRGALTELLHRDPAHDPDYVRGVMETSALLYDRPLAILSSHSRRILRRRLHAAILDCLP